MSPSFSKSFLKAMLLVGTAGIAAPAFAQDATPTAADNGDEAIVITGSRIVRQDLQSNVPIAASFSPRPNAALGAVGASRRSQCSHARSKSRAINVRTFCA